MKGYLRTVVLMYSMCCVFSLPLHRLIKRNVTNEKVSFLKKDKKYVNRCDMYDIC